MAVQFCPHCEVPLTKDEERGRRCPACKKSLRVAPEPSKPREPDEPDALDTRDAPYEAEQWHALPRPQAPRTVAVSVVAVLMVLMGFAHTALGVGLTISLEQARQKALEPTKVVQKDGTVREYPADGCVVAVANLCLPVFMVFTVGLALLGFGLTLTGIGLWKRRRWARVVTFCWMCLVAQASLPMIVSENNSYLVAVGVIELVFSVLACVVLYRNRAEFRRKPVEEDYED